MHERRRTRRFLMYLFVCLLYSQLTMSPIESQISVLNEHDKDEVSNKRPPQAEIGDDTDYLLALTLQKEFNNEFNGLIKEYESNINRKSKSNLFFWR